MCRRPHHSLSRRCFPAIAALLLPMAGGFCQPAGAARAAGGSDGGQPARYVRPDAETIRAETRNVLAEPRFAPRRSFWQWLRERLSRWGGPDIEFGKGWTRVVFWIVTVWCVLTLAAILAHFVWTVVVLWRTRSGRGARGSGIRHPRFGKEGGLSYHSLVERMRLVARRGSFREAARLMMLALLRFLDETDVVKYHQSKTNGDYVREYPAGLGGREGFRRLVRDLDAVVYGRVSCDRRAYLHMNSLFDGIRGDVGKAQQV